MKKFLLHFLLATLLITGVNAQDKINVRNTTSERAPINNLNNDGSGLNSPMSYGDRFFGQNAGASSFFTKGFLNTSGTLANFGPSSTSLFGAMEFGPDGTLYCIAVAAGSPLQTLDTSTGVLTSLGAITGIGAEQVLGMSWNPVNSTMYMTTIPAGSDKLYSLDLTTRVATFIGSVGQSQFDIAINSLGLCYGVSVADNLISINLVTGLGTIVGPIGFDANFIQGLSFDRSTDSLWYACYNQTAGSGQLRTVNLLTGSTTLIAPFQALAEVCGFAIRGRKVFPLNAFNLLLPSDGTRIVTVAGSLVPVNITWDTSASGATYRFIFGNPVVPPRRFTIPATSNSINTTLGALDVILAANGFTNNGSATDSAVGQWDVWAYKAPQASGPDSMKATNGPRGLTFRRQQVSLAPFALSSPASGISITTSPVDLTVINFVWGRSGVGSTYRWLYKTGGSYTDPATLRIPGNNLGLDTMWSVRNSRLDSILAGIGVNPGDSISGFWRARSYSSSDSLNSTAPDRSITFRRAGLLPLNQDFVDATFPPAFWGLDIGGGTTQYWTRNAVGGYQTGVGSAKYDFWTAQSTTPLQTLTSNQFPAVSSPTNYLRFNYSHAFYLAGGILANDSCIIETSTNNGSTWTRLIGMGASQTLSLGYNSTPIMTTVGGPVPGAFTPTAANQWATKIYVMPAGTNKVRFVAKSDFGNNLYIDNITSGTATGTGTPISLIPERYELQQNYPNPFNPMTTINFSIPKQSHVTVKVYDMLGKEVTQLVNEMKTPGNYSIDFNGANFSSGVYFYKIEAGEFVDVKRMMLIK